GTGDEKDVGRAALTEPTEDLLGTRRRPDDVELVVGGQGLAEVVELDSRLDCEKGFDRAARHGLLGYRDTVARLAVLFFVGCAADGRLEADRLRLVAGAMGEVRRVLQAHPQAGVPAGARRNRQHLHVRPEQLLRLLAVLGGTDTDVEVDGVAGLELTEAAVDG